MVRFSGGCLVKVVVLQSCFVWTRLSMGFGQYAIGFVEIWILLLEFVGSLQSRVPFACTHAVSKFDVDSLVFTIPFLRCCG